MRRKTQQLSPFGAINDTSSCAKTIKTPSEGDSSALAQVKNQHLAKIVRLFSLSL
jgi:hypothetical protein